MGKKKKKKQKDKTKRVSGDKMAGVKKGRKHRGK